MADRLSIKVKISVHPRQTPYGESYKVDTNNSFLQRIEKNILAPNRIKPIYTSSVADENIFANKLNVQVLTVGPIGGNLTSNYVYFTF